MKKELQAKFLSNAAHELRTPLAAIKEGITLVADESLGSLTAKQKQFLDLSRRNVERLRRLIDDVFDFQKAQNELREIGLIKQNLNDLIADVHKAMLNFALEKSLVFELDLQAGIPEVRMNRGLIECVLKNLVKNAIVNTDRGSIVICSSLSGNQIHVQIKDTGIGIQPQNMERLFVEFEQFGEQNRCVQASGLGLVICKEIIQAHKGEIWAQSQWGQGSNFQFTLPVDGE